MNKIYKIDTKNPTDAQFVMRMELGLVFGETEQQCIDSAEKWRSTYAYVNRKTVTKYG